MKRFLMIAVLAAALAALLAGTALAAPGDLPTQGFGPGAGMRARVAGAEGACGMCGGAGATGATMRRGAPEWAGQPDEVAELLDMTADEMQAARQEGQSLAQIAEGQGVTFDELVDTILTAKKATLDELVAAEKLTQAQADLMIERMESQVKVMVTRETTGPMMGRQQGTRPMGQGMRGGGRAFNR